MAAQIQHPHRQLFWSLETVLSNIYDVMPNKKALIHLIIVLWPPFEAKNIFLYHLFFSINTASSWVLVSLFSPFKREASATKFRWWLRSQLPWHLLNGCISAFGLGSSSEFLILNHSQNEAVGEVVSPVLFLPRSSWGCPTFPYLPMRTGSLMKISMAIEKLHTNSTRMEAGLQIKE